MTLYLHAYIKLNNDLFYNRKINIKLYTNYKHCDNNYQSCNQRLMNYVIAKWRNLKQVVPIHQINVY